MTFKPITKDEAVNLVAAHTQRVIDKELRQYKKLEPKIAKICDKGIRHMAKRGSTIAYFYFKIAPYYFRPAVEEAKKHFPGFEFDYGRNYMAIRWPHS